MFVVRVLFCVLICRSVFSQTVSLVWDSNPEPDIAGYSVYRSDQSGQGYVRLNSSLLPQASYQDSQVVSGNTYYYVVTATNSSGWESGFSAEVSHTVNSVRGAILQVGRVRVDHRAKTITMGLSFSNPVVVAAPLSYFGRDPSVARVTDVSAGSFNLAVKEWEYLDGRHALEEISYVVSEGGRFVLPNGAQAEAGTVSLGNNPIGRRVFNFQAPFSTAPVLVTSLNTANDATAAVPRIIRVAQNQFEVILQEEEAEDQRHAAEILSYLAWEPGPGTVAGVPYEAGVKPRVHSEWSTLSFNSPFTSSPCFIAGMQTYSGTDTANLRFRNKNTSSVQVFVSEERSKDIEVQHVRETVGYIALQCSTKSFIVSP